jgi:hypothetical protein
MSRSANCCGDGKIVEGEIYYDATTIMTQLGHMPPTAF